MIYGYARVSTTAQSTDGNSLEAQAAELKEKGATTIITESYTGTKMNRPKFTELLAILQPGDTLMVTKLDRFARTVRDGITVIDELLAQNITIHILNMGVLDNTPVGKLTRTMFLAFAEFERDMIVQRTAEGKRVAKLNNPDYKDGRKPIHDKVDMTEFKRLRDLVAQKVLKPIQAYTELGISKSSWYKLIRTANN